jgi:beta-lactamase regulating signal transducer with metallopeptidase domain
MSAVLVAVVAWSAQFGIVIAAAAVTLAVTRLRSPRARLAACQATLLAALVLPFVPAVLPPVTGLVVAGPLLAGSVVGTAGHAPAAELETWSAVILACLAAGIALRGVWMMVGWRRQRRWREIQAASSAVFDEAAAELGVEARLVCAEPVASPFTFGWRAPVVVADARLLADPHTARAVFLHELEHVARRDWLFVVAEEVVRAVLWFHPAA